MATTTSFLLSVKRKRSQEAHLRIPGLHLQRFSDCGDCATKRKSVTITIKNEVYEIISKNNLKHRIERIEDYLDDHMDNFMNITQLVMTAIMLLCVIVSGIAHIVMGHLSLIGILVVALFVFLTWQMCKIAWTEYQQDKNK